MNANGASESSGHGRNVTLLAALGVVFGDIGTSPLYAMRECFHGLHGIDLNYFNILGVLSIIIWSLIIVISIKYIGFVLRADNKGEGGILALMALISPRTLSLSGSRLGLVTMLGIFGAALLYGDGVITPAISVLSAVEGLKILTPAFEPYVLLITVLVLIGLFLIQSKGTAKIGRAFGPVILVWFLVLGVMGVVGIVSEPAVLKAINPWYGLNFLIQNTQKGFIVLGSVFLVVTGGEALYADLGHFGRPAIQKGWFYVALPALVLQYMGQGALLIREPEALENPFFHLAPNWALLPLVILATFATIIASQAVITGAFSLSQQAVQLGYLPRIRVRHTSEVEMGQIYVPFVNWVLLAGTLYLVLEFGSSSRLAAAYGIAVTLTMVITTLLTFVVMRRRWEWKLYQVVPLTLFFLVIDLAFFGANSIKVLDGGWFPLVLASAIFILMTTWKDGRKQLAARLVARSTPLDQFLSEYMPDIRARIPGTAIFLAATSKGTPAALIQNSIHNRIVHETVILLTISTESVPHVKDSDRVAIEAVGNGFYRMQAKYGFMESPDVPMLLKLVEGQGPKIKPESTTYFLGRETLIAAKLSGMPVWRERLFAFMAQNAQRATDYFKIPSDRAIEIGTVVEI